jgi:DNA-binding winged helix-turn-helix (wHTH) protein
MEAFKINNQFTVLPEKNIIINEVKLEPRLMKLLCLLVSNNGKLVSREEIIENIWNGYGGGEEGLTQAISFLRKALNDSDKTIISTVSKGGYVFRGNIQNLQSPSISETHLQSLKGYSNIRSKTIGLIGGTLIVILVLFIYLYFSNKNITPQPDIKKQDSFPGNYTPKPE